MVQETEFQHSVIDAVVLVLLSIAGPDQKTNMKAARGGLSTPVRASSSYCESTRVVCTVSVNASPSHTWQVTPVWSVVEGASLLHGLHNTAGARPQHVHAGLAQHACRGVILGKEARQCFGPATLTWCAGDNRPSAAAAISAPRSVCCAACGLQVPQAAAQWHARPLPEAPGPPACQRVPGRAL